MISFSIQRPQFPIFQILMLTFSLLSCNCRADGGDVGIIPRPEQMRVEEGSFGIGAQTAIVLEPDTGETRRIADLLKTYLGDRCGIVGIEKSDGRDEIVLRLKEGIDLGAEGYALDVSKAAVVIEAQDPSGLLYGVQTIRQMLPAASESQSAKPKTDLSLPCLHINDKPRYGWRGIMLDEARHFFGKRVVMDLLDQMAFYKLNRFHWHLTDYKGWRMEIDKYPKLTTVGGIGDNTDPDRPARFYSKEDIDEIIEYAEVRGIEIIPEIDMPGHASAANRAYPEYSGGGNRKRPDSTFNPADPETIAYLKDILKEVADLFPSQWLHFGGDEVGHISVEWPDLPAVRELMEGKAYEHLWQVEHHFNRVMSEYINDLGKTTIGWDEVADAGIPRDDCILMWWRHNKPRVRNKAIKDGYRLILCPRIPLYFDFVQDDNHSVGRRWGGKFCTLDKVYDYPCLPDFYKEDGHDEVIGIQANIWTKHIWDEQRLDFMVFPRIAALAEAAWTLESRKDYEDFMIRLKSQLARYDIRDIYYFNPFNPDKTPEPRR